jgi:sugar lactone lactonase YvrE
MPLPARPTFAALRPTIGALKQTIGTVRSTVAALVPASAAVVIANALLGANVAAQPNPYTTIDAWLHAPAGRALGAASSVAAARDGTLWIAERCGANDCSTSDVAPMLHADADGNVLASFGAGRFAWPHGIRVDADGNVWVTDARGGNGRGHQVLKLDSAGELLLALGEAGVAGSDTAHFNGPTDVAIARNGDVFVSDGHEDASNNRVLKFSRDGKFIVQWGRTGSKPGEFLVPHALAFDSQGRLFVADRDNNRIQIFAQDGRFLAEWTQFGRPSGLYIAADDTLYVSDNQSNTERHPGWSRGIRVGSARDGRVSAFIPDAEFDPARAQETGAHGLTVDASRNIYGAEVFGQKVKKYLPR